MADPSAGNRPGVTERIAVVAVALSVAVMIVALAVIRGFKHEVTARMVGFAAHVEVVDPAAIGGLESRPIRAGEAVERLIAAQPGFVRMNRYALKGGILRTSEAMEGVVLQGVDGAFDWSFFAGALDEGELPRVGDSVRTKDLLLSRSVARRLGLRAGDRIELLFVEEGRTPRRDRFKISGIYSTGMAEMESVALTDLRNVQRLSDWAPDEISGYAVYVDDFARAERFAAALDDALFAADDLPDDESLAAVGVARRYPNVFDWLKAHDVNAAVIIGIMLVVALFNMISALLILVLERTRMIGLLKVLGMENGRIRRIFLWRAAMVVARGLAWGNAAGLLLCAAQRGLRLVKLDPEGYLLSEVPVSLEAGWWLALNVVTAGVILLLLVGPAALIARIKPSETIRYE